MLSFAHKEGSMKKLFFSLALCSIGIAQHRESKKESDSPVAIVVASNPSPYIGIIAAPTLLEAKLKIATLAFLDPVCQSAPAICEARIKNTTYNIVHKDGSITTE